MNYQKAVIDKLLPYIMYLRMQTFQLSAPGNRGTIYFRGLYTDPIILRWKKT